MSGTQPARDVDLVPAVPSTTDVVPHGDEAADVVVAAVLAVPGVVQMHTGTFGEVATYLPGRRVNGVRLRPDGTTEVHVVLRFGAPVLDTADRVRRAVQEVRPGSVDVNVQDVVAVAADGGAL